MEREFLEFNPFPLSLASASVFSLIFNNKLLYVLKLFSLVTLPAFSLSHPTPSISGEAAK